MFLTREDEVLRASLHSFTAARRFPLMSAIVPQFALRDSGHRSAAGVGRDVLIINKALVSGGRRSRSRSRTHVKAIGRATLRLHQCLLHCWQVNTPH